MTHAAALQRRSRVAVPDTPFFVYDIPQFAVNGDQSGLAGRLTEEIASFAGLKSSRIDVQIVRQLADALREDKILLTGNESAALGCWPWAPMA